MQRESPLHRGERFAIEAHLLAQWLDAANYDVATFAEYLVDDDEGGKSPCFVHAWSFDAISDFRWLQRWTAVKDVGPVIHSPRISTSSRQSVTRPKKLRRARNLVELFGAQSGDFQRNIARFSPFAIWNSSLLRKQLGG